MMLKSPGVVRCLLTAIACAGIVAAVLVPSQALAQRTQKTVPEIGAEWQRAGLLSQAEYIELRRITASVAAHCAHRAKNTMIESATGRL